MEDQQQRRAVAAEAVSTLAAMLLSGADRTKFKTCAVETSQAFSAADIPVLRSFLHNPPPEPPQYDPSVHGLGGWLSCCQFAVFELIFHMGEEALPFLRQIAWGEYDWTQGNAIELLIRLAAAGVRTEEIIAEIETGFPNIRDEAALYAIKPLLGELDADARLKCVFERLMAIESFNDAYEELTWVDPDPYNIGKTHLHASVSSAAASDLRVMNMHVIARLEGADIASQDLKREGGRARICITDDCALLKPGSDDVEPIGLPELLQARKIAIGHYALKSFEDGATCIYPRSIAVLE